METEQMTRKNMQVQIPSGVETLSTDMEIPGAPNTGHGLPGLTRQPSSAKSNCLCSPTTHPGSFRCRLHRSPSLQKTKSMDSPSVRDPTSKAITGDAYADQNH
ncbi:serine-rich protein-related [Quillaja saponaria]|uniref:Serine-rich protein-related n=1 Tax=Quillaja saponaria TaxID=32244 RepID=A0AAD7KPP8_QUISA|nr:serine-rich protein-related [Quillaja saponaria]